MTKERIARLDSRLRVQDYTLMKEDCRLHVQS